MPPHWYSYIFTHRHLCLMGILMIYLMGTTENLSVLWVKLKLFTKGVGITLLNKKREQKLIIFFHTQNFSYLDFFTINVFFLVHDLIFEVSLSILTTFVQNLGTESSNSYHWYLLWSKAL